jgi:hypothetical protein
MATEPSISTAFIDWCLCLSRVALGIAPHSAIIGSPSVFAMSNSVPRFVVPAPM